MSTKNPYTHKRNISALICLIALALYSFIPGDSLSAQKIVLLLIFFVMIMVVTFFQQSYRSWELEQRDPHAYDSQGRYHKERDSRRNKQR